MYKKGEGNGSVLGRLLATIKDNLEVESKLPRLLAPILFSMIYLAGYRLFAFKNQSLVYLYYAILLFLCMLNYDVIKAFLKRPADYAALPCVSGGRTDILFTYPLFLIAFVSIINTFLVYAGLIPKDAQNLSSLSISLSQLVSKGSILVLVAFTEEMYNLLLVAAIYRIIRRKDAVGAAVSIFAGAMIFGLLHAFNWNLYAAAAIGISFIPFFIMTFYLRSIWTSTAAHFYNDLITLAGMYSPFASKGLMVLLLVPCISGLVVQSLRARGRG